MRWRWMRFDRDHFLASPRGIHARARKLDRNTAVYSLPADTLSKRASTPAARLDLQKNVLEQLMAAGRWPYRGPVAAELEVFTDQKNPPQLHTVAKHLMDIFGKRMGPEIPRKALVYQDDRQVRYLSVMYTPRLDASPGICARFLPMGSFVETVGLAAHVLGKYDHRNYELRCFAHPPDIEREFDHSRLDSLRDLRRDRARYVAMLGDRAYGRWLAMQELFTQEEYLQRLALTIPQMRFLFPATSTFRLPPDWFAQYPIRIQLPRIPTRRGASEAFKAGVRERMRAFRDQSTILAPLRVPVALQVLYQPPAAHDGFFKDVDNIMRLIVPVFHEEFRPTLRKDYGMKIEEIEDVAMRRRLEQLEEAIPKSVLQSITRYEIFHLERDNTSSPDGFLSVGITADDGLGKSILQRSRELLDDWWEKVGSEEDDDW